MIVSFIDVQFESLEDNDSKNHYVPETVKVEADLEKNELSEL